MRNALVGATNMQQDTWRDRAACRGEDPNKFFILPGQSEKPALKLCDDCPVRVQCLEQGITEKFGIWGGYTIQGRKRLMARTRQRSA